MAFTHYGEMFNLTGRVAVVTGGGGLLGSEICRVLAEFGAVVVVVDIDMTRAVSVADGIESAGLGTAVAYECDVSIEISVQQMVAGIVSQFGRIDILINNAAGKSDNLDSFFEELENYDIKEWRSIMSVNMDGMFLVAREIGKTMCRQSGGGSIVQTASIYGVVAPDQRIYEGSHYLGREINTPAVYSASKAGVIGLTRHLATYWAESGVRVNSVSPGGIESGQNSKFISKYSQKVPMNRMGRSEEIVGAVLYLASDASSYVTGHNLVIDGGLSCW
jgi:NAD(P)-dependent dehydrogenase (short-subunit alcohol dehydrogenase family)